jgi:transcriptional regulator with XRE-family HTH domain
MAHTLPNYLRCHRKRAGLTQAEVAYLLGCRNAAKVSRYERFRRMPALDTALACEAIFRVPVRALFPGAHKKTVRAMVQRSRLLARRLTRHPSSPTRTRKLEFLRSLSVEGSSSPPKGA